MNAHDPHHICMLIQGSRLPEIHIILFQLFDIADKMEQAKIAGFLKVRGLCQQHLHVGPALAACGHGGDILQIVMLPDDGLQQLADGHVDRIAAIGIQALDKAAAFLRQLRVRLLSCAARARLLLLTARLHRQFRRTLYGLP